MEKLLGNVKVSGKLVIAFGTLIFLVLVIMGFNLFCIGCIEKMQKIVIAVEESEGKMLDAHQHAISYLYMSEMSNDSRRKLFEIFKELMISVKSSVSSIDNLSKDKTILGSTKTVSDEMVKYEELVLKTYQLQEEIGLTDDDGFRAIMISSARDAENICKSQGLNRQLINILNLRRQEKNYFIRMDDESLSKFHKEAKKLEASIIDEGLSKELQGKIQKYLADFQVFQEKLKERQNNLKTIDEIMEKVKEPMSSLKIYIVGDEAKKQLGQIKKTMNKVFINNIIVGLVSIILGIILTITFTSLIVNPIKKIQMMMLKMAQGDLRLCMTHSDRKDEFGEMQNVWCDMKTIIWNLVKDVSATSVTVASSSQELSATSDETSKSIQHVAVTVQEVARGAQNTAKNVEKAGNSVENTAQAIHKIAKEIEQVSQYSTKVEKEAALGKEKAEQAVSKINQVKDTVLVSSKIVSILGEKSIQIGEIVGVITGIASQTNLLALNAAIEAARAGEAGRGFAVVADEVRKLAEESSKAAENIRKLIKEITSEMDRALDAMEHSNVEVDNGAKVVIEAGEALKTIVEHIDQIARRIEGLGLASEGISQSTHEITEAISNISAASQQSASSSESASSATEEQTAAVEEISASAQQLAKLAESLQAMVSKFTV